MDVSGDERTDFGEDFRLVRKRVARVRREDFLHKTKFKIHRRRTYPPHGIFANPRNEDLSLRPLMWRGIGREKPTRLKFPSFPYKASRVRFSVSTFVNLQEIYPAQRMEDTPDLCCQRNAGEDILTIHQSMG